MRRSLAPALLALLLSACAAQTGFQHSTTSNTEEQGAGEITVTPDALTWTNLTVGTPESQYFKITDSGEQTLHVYEVSVISTADGQFAMADVPAFDLDTGLDKELAVICTLSADAEATGELRIKSNDANNLDLRIELDASPAADTGDTGSGDTGSGDTGSGT